MLSSANSERYWLVKTTLLIESKNNAVTKSSRPKTVRQYRKKKLYLPIYSYNGYNAFELKPRESLFMVKTWGNSEFEKLIRALLQRFPLCQHISFYEFWTLLNLTTVNYISNKVDIGIEAS